MFLVVVAIFAWPGYQGISAVVPSSDPIPPDRETAQEAAGGRPQPSQTARATTSAAQPDQESTSSKSEVAVNSGPTDVPDGVSTIAPTNTAIPTATPLPSPIPVPHLRHLDEKLYMLELINTERKRVGSPEVLLGDNNAAQLHAESSLEGCHSSHWGSDGLKPYMRYSLAGGYQSNGENGSGSDYCVRAADGYRALSGVKTEIRETMIGWMNSSGHRRNVLEKTHRKVNIGLAWDRYNLIAVQHFEGDYVEYDSLPVIDNGKLKLEGMVKNGARFGVGDTIPVQIFYDPPPHPLTPGQLSRTYCYNTGRPIAYVREPLTGGWSYPNDSLSTSYTACPDPYDVPSDAPAPRSPDEAHRHWDLAYRASQSLGKMPAVMQAITASSWKVGNSGFRVIANLGSVLNKHGPGVYTVVLWGEVGGDFEVISKFSIFHNVPRPAGYD